MTNKDKLLTIIVPSFNEEQNIDNTIKKVCEVMEKENINFEILFVSDGSKDKTYELILEKSNQDSRIRGIEFSRNFGKEAAIFAGLREGNGDCFVIMDCDLQHPPETIVEMYKKWLEGYEIVEGIKSSRGKESFLHKKFANLFYKILSNLTGFNMKDTSDFKLIDKKVANILISLSERKTFFRALTFWTGFKSCKVYYEVGERKYGKSKWSIISLVKYAIVNIISFSSKPLNIVTHVGGFSIIIGIIIGVYTLIDWFTGHALEGFTTVIMLLLLLGGFILIGLGIIGQYISMIYEEVKHRPRYLIQYDTRENKIDK